MEALPDGYATRIHDGGSNLSAGQRQRFAVARALLGRPRILLLDEPAARLDAEPGETVWDSLRRLAQVCTTLVISHDPADLRWADRTVDRYPFCGRPDALNVPCPPTEHLDLVASRQS
ncbi:MAG: ATP-binding cassette domain-containing protein [Planctomycetes bacterium]|nr:ATP-binding cassette domain-containing protein [Planctomycetota bacterium]